MWPFWPRSFIHLPSHSHDYQFHMNGKFLYSFRTLHTCNFRLRCRDSKMSDKLVKRIARLVCCMSVCLCVLVVFVKTSAPWQARIIAALDDGGENIESMSTRHAISAQSRSRPFHIQDPAADILRAHVCIVHYYCAPQNSVNWKFFCAPQAQGLSTTYVIRIYCLLLLLVLFLSWFSFFPLFIHSKLAVFDGFFFEMEGDRQWKICGYGLLRAPNWINFFSSYDFSVQTLSDWVHRYQ